MEQKGKIPEKSRDGWEKVTASHIALLNIFYIDELVEPVRLLFLEDVLFVGIEEIVGILVFWCDVEFSECFWVFWVEFINKINIFL